ncbi:MAG: trigger factor [Verrucomicrobiota bacterium]
MNVTIENLAPCRKKLRVDVDAQTVDQTFDSVTNEMQRTIRLPGFRPGKVPASLITKNFSKDLDLEVRKRLINDSYKKALSEHKIHAVGSPEVKEGDFGRNQNFTFDIEVETAPEFELPEYKGIPAKKEIRTVNDEDMKRALDVLRERMAHYHDVDRPIQEGDVVVVNYTGTSEGKPLTDFAPTARGLTSQQGFWLEIKPNSFLPGFGEQLVGASKGDKRTVNVDFPKDFVTPQLAEKKGTYEVEIVQVKEKHLPEVDEKFAKEWGTESVEKLNEAVRKDLEREIEINTRKSIRTQILEKLNGGVQCELPQSLVEGETRATIYNIVNENQRRGVAREVVDENKNQIFDYASNTAKEKLKTAFLLGKIAEKENIRVTQEEVAGRVMQMAQERQVAPQKLVKELQKVNGLGEVHEQILFGKVLDFLEKNATIEEVQPSSENTNQPAS